MHQLARFNQAIDKSVIFHRFCPKCHIVRAKWRNRDYAVHSGREEAFIPLSATLSRSSKTPSRTRRRQQPPAAPTPPDRAFELASTSTAFARNETVFLEGLPADCIYKIESGCVRTYATLENGERQLVAFHVPGDCFGLEDRGVHMMSAEATTDSAILVVKRKTLMARNPDVAMVRYLLDLTAGELRRTRRHNMLLLKGAQERVIGFLLEMKERGHSDREIALHMTRRDIADYLGLTIETVSRTLSRLEAESTISLPTPWRIVLHDTAALNLQ